MGSRQSRPSGAEARGVPGRCKGSVGGRSPAEEPPQPRLGPDCRLASLLLGSGKLPAGLRKRRPAAPYVRRLRWLRDIQAALGAHQHERALRLLRLLRQDLGLEGTFLNDVLYKKATFLNLVDPISHDLLMSLARDLQCPKKEYDPWKSSDRICRQLIYHLSPHSKWHRSGVPHCKSRHSLQKQLSQEAIHLSGVPLSTRDLQRLASYLQHSGDRLLTLDLSFTDLKDEEMRFLMPFLRSLPSLTHLSLNGNHLTRATVKDLTDAMKDLGKFPSLAWLDLGNNVDVSSMPQPLLVGLRKRLSQQTTLPTIYESSGCTSETSSGPETSLLEEEEDLQREEGIPPVAKHRFHQAPLDGRDASPAHFLGPFLTFLTCSPLLRPLPPSRVFSRAPNQATHHNAAKETIWRCRGWAVVGRRLGPSFPSCAGSTGPERRARSTWKD